MKRIVTKSTQTLIAAGISALVLVGVAYAGTLTAPSGTPAAEGYTLSDIYARLTTNATSTAGNHSLSTTTAPAPSFYTLTQVYSAIPTIDATKVATGTSYLGVAGSAYPAKPLKTNQTLCYDPSGNSTSTISCAGSNQDGQYQKGVARSYADNGDGTITDNSTGLMWWKCTYGQSGSNCSGGSGNYVDFPTAIATCEADVTGGHSDWRLPNVMELESLVDFSTSSPAINSTYFPNTVSDYWWSATTYAIPDDQYVAWIVGFGDGGVSSDNKAATYLVRCVRG